MAKRLFAFLVVLAMLLSMIPVFAAAAEVSDPALIKHTHSDAHACSEQCGGTVNWIAWGEADKLPTDSGHYYLTCDVQLTANNDVAAGKDITICLNGYNIRAKANTKVAFVYGKLTISDCTAYELDGTYISGTVVGSTAGDGAVYGVRRGGTFVLESGRITGGKTTGTGGGGVIYTQGGTSAGAGGMVYMYGGEMVGVEGYNGGAVCLGGGSAAYTPSAFYMYGGKITGNYARNHGGGIYVVDWSILEIHGGEVTGNTVKNKAAAVYMAGANSKLTVSGAAKLDGVFFNDASNKGLQVDGLTEGAAIDVTTTATDFAKVISIAQGGKQDSWSAHWVTANGESVSMVEGAFKAGHYHGNVKYEAWVGSDSHNTLPTAGKNYYLANDILRNTNGGTVSIAAGTTQHMCLNGHTITHRNPANRLYAIQGTFVLEDCTAKTQDGQYLSGGIAYGGATPSTRTYGNCFNVQRGGTMIMEEGQIYGFTSDCKDYEDSVPVYIQGATAGSKAVFIMNGGQIHSNSSKSMGAAIKSTRNATPDLNNPSLVEINGGKIWGNTSTTGGAVAATGDVLKITGGIITDNTTVGGAVQALDMSRIQISGNPTVWDNKGGNLHLAGDIVIELGNLTDGKMGVSAAKAGRGISTEIASDPTAFFVSDNSELKLSYKNHCLYLGATHEHGIDGKAGDMGWSKWTSTDSLPSAAGNYYLANDIQLKDAQATLTADVNLCLNGKTVTAKSGKRIMAIGNGGELTITDCCETCGKITGGTHDYGAAFNVNRGGSLKLYNGKLTGNTSGQEGGAVYIQAAGTDAAGGKFQMYGGEISGNTAKRGGAVCLAGSDLKTSQGAFALYGGVIKDNTAVNGGAIYTYQNAIVAVAGGEVTGNSATAAGGGMYIHTGVGRLQLTGNPVIKDNKSGTTNDNIHLLGDATITVAELTDGAQIFVTAAKCDRAVTNEVTEAEAAFFHSDSAYRMIVYKDGKVYFEISDEHIHCDCFYKTQGCGHTEHKWQAWESTTSLPTISGSYYLVEDVHLTETATIPENQDVKLCLNGKTISGTKLLLIRKNSTLSITDCGTTGTITGGNRNYGGAVNVNRMATFNLYGGTITGNSAGVNTSGASLGGGVYIQAGKTGEPGGIFNMYGGTLSKNDAYQGGAIHLALGENADAVPAQVNLYGGTIIGNTAGGEVTKADGTVSVKGGSGAAIYIGKYGELNMVGGLVTENAGLGYGGTIYLSGATGTFSGGTITKNTATRDGAGFYAVSGSQVEITGSVVISDNTSAKGAGGGIGASSKSYIKMTGGTVSGNWAIQGGGAIIQSGAALELQGGVFSGNYSKNYAGAIYVNTPNADGTPSSLKMTGGTITKNESTNAGGGIYAKQAKVDITGGTVSYNETKNYGCGVYLHTSTGTITGGTITGNVSGKDGAGLYGYGGTVEIGGDVKITNNTSLKGAGGGMGFTKECKAKLTGGTISGNKAVHAGGIIVQGKAHLTMTGGNVAYNTTTGSGGGVYVNKSSMDCYGGTIANNKSVKTGGGLFANESMTRFAGTTFANNQADGNGGATYINKGAASYTAGTFKDNSSQRYGGGMSFNAAQIEAKNIKVIGNFAKLGSGGTHGYDGKITMENVLYSENSTDVAAGGLCVTRFCDLTVNHSIFEKNKANNGGALLVQNWAKANLNDCIIRENETSEGSGLYLYNNVEAWVNGGEICDNVAYTKLNKAGATVGGRGAGVFLHTDRTTYSGASTLHMDGTRISGNKAELCGAGIYVDMQMILEAANITVDKNTAPKGAGVYTATGTTVTLKDAVITANTAQTTGSGIYAQADLILHNVSVTANTTQEGSAVYLAPARFDGHSFMAGIVKFSGDMKIAGNTGTMPDLFVDEGTTISVDAAGLGEDTEIYLQLHSGLVTYTIFGAYDYEGENGIYTLTYGDRSVTEPEYDPSLVVGAQQTKTQKTDSGNVWLYAGVAVIALAAIAGVVLLLLKKKKSPAGEGK